MPAQWQMLLPIWNDIIVTDGKPLRQILYLIVNVGRSSSLVADGMASFYYAVADVITIVIVDRWYIYTGGRCCCLCVLYCCRW